MRAIVCTGYGPPEMLQPREVAKPVPREDEVLIRIRATAVTASDTFVRGASVPWRWRIPMRLMIGITRPRQPILGLMLAGEVEAAGRRISRFVPGDRVYGMSGFTFGAYAEYLCLRETDSTRGCLAHMPVTIGFEGATVVAYGGLLALHFLDKGKLGPGRRVLIYGASGTTGTIAVQVARQRGAHVTAVCSGANLELVRSLGAHAAIDYTRQERLGAGERFDLVLDAVGEAKSSPLKRVCRRALSSGGRYVSIDDESMELSSSRLTELSDLVDAGHVRPVIDRCYRLEEMAAAHAYVGQGHKRGGVAITV